MQRFIRFSQVNRWDGKIRIPICQKLELSWQEIGNLAEDIKAQFQQGIYPDNTCDNEGKESFNEWGKVNS